MKQSQLKLSQKKHQLYEMKCKGQKNPRWRLTKEELEYIHSIGFKTTPWLYEIKTRTFQNVKILPSICKELHYAKLNGKRVLNKTLKVQEKNILKENGVKFKILKHEIHLR